MDAFLVHLINHRIVYTMIKHSYSCCKCNRFIHKIFCTRYENLPAMFGEIIEYNFKKNYGISPFQLLPHSIIPWYDDFLNVTKNYFEIEVTVLFT